MKGQPFRRAAMVFAAIQAVIAEFGVNAPSYRFAGIPEYVSRGNGRGGVIHRHGHKHRSKYMPHQGAQECARRMGANHG